MLVAFEQQSLFEIEEHWSLEDLMHATEMFSWKMDLQRKANEAASKGRG